MAKGVLTQKRELFANYYVEEGGDASKAYRRAFSSANMKDETVYNNAYKLLQNNEVLTRIKELQAELQKRSDITKDRVLDDLGAILDSKITDYVNLVTRTVRLPQNDNEIEAGNPPQTMEVQSLVFKDFDELTERQVKAIESVKQGKNGIELKLHGKSWTIERICKMLGFDAPERFEGKFIDDRVQSSPLNAMSVEKLKKMRKIYDES